MNAWCSIVHRGRVAAVPALLLAAFACGSPAVSTGPTTSPDHPRPSDTAAATTTTSRPALATPAPTAAPSPSPTPSPSQAPWRPSLQDTFQIQYEGTVNLTVAATVYDLDVDSTTAATIATLHKAGRHVFCYIDAGAWENYRSDAAAFPKSVLGKVMDGWPDERWLDIRQIDRLAPLLRARLDRCKAKGFDGVDPDNVNGYTNATGFPLTAADQLRFNRWLAGEVHARGMAVALKNDGEQAATLAKEFDAAVVEQCVEYGECAMYSPFVAAGKPVFDIEYARAPSAFCPTARKLHFTIVGKHESLDAYRTGC